MIRYHLDQQGGFTAGDTDTGLTAYAYPASNHATRARRDPASVAAHMLRHERWRANLTRDAAPHLHIYDARNWERLRGRGGVAGSMGK